MRGTRVVVALALLLAITIGPAVGADDPRPAPPTRHPGWVSTADTLGGFVPDNIFIQLEPCRVVDTRAGGGGRLAIDAVRSYRVLDEFFSGNFSDQGGNPDGCFSSALATAVHVNITAVDPSSKGFVRAWAYDEPTPPVPNATVLSYSNALSASNGVTVQVCNQFLTDPDNCNKDLFVKNFGATTHLVIDILGYYTPQTYAEVDPDGALIFGNQVDSSERTGEGEYVVTFAQFLPACSWITSLQGNASGHVTAELDPNFQDPTILVVHTTDAAGVAADRQFAAWLRC